MPMTSATAIVSAMLTRSARPTCGASPSGTGGASGSAIAISAERFSPPHPHQQRLGQHQHAPH